MPPLVVHKDSTWPRAARARQGMKATEHNSGTEGISGQIPRSVVDERRVTIEGELRLATVEEHENSPRTFS